jgi:hypothetical protein
MSYSYEALTVRSLLETFTPSNGSIKSGHIPSAGALASNCKSPDLKQAVLEFRDFLKSRLSTLPMYVEAECLNDVLAVQTFQSVWFT